MSESGQAAVAPGREVELHFTLALEDGTEADSTRGGEPLRFTVGDGTLAPGLEVLLLGLCAGEDRQMQLPPDGPFGPHDPERLHRMPRSEFDETLPLERGTVIGFTTPDGEEVPGTVLEGDAETVLVDFNHPLAGRALRFDVEIRAVR